MGNRRREGGELERALDPLLRGVQSRLVLGEVRVALELLEHREQAMIAEKIPESDPRWGLGWGLKADLDRTIGHPDVAEQGARKLFDAAEKHGWNTSRAEAMRLMGRLAHHRGEPEAWKSWFRGGGC